MQDKKKILFDKSTIRDSKIKISTTNPNLKDKIKLDLSFETEKVCWHIKFNIPLNPDTVSKKTMNITETNGYILDTIINYDPQRHIIKICPSDIYIQNEYYILNISNKVESEKGQKLKEEIHIMFKLVGNKVKEYQLLESTAKIMKPRPRTRRYRQELRRKAVFSKVYSLDNKIYSDIPQHKLPYSKMQFNILLGFVGILPSIGGIVLNNIILIIVGFIICLIGLIYIGLQFANKYKRSMSYYNLGVMYFNMSKYKSANKFFKKALLIFEGNEMAEYGLNKTYFYLE